MYLTYTRTVAPLPPELAKCTGFQWDIGNVAKVWARHQVMPGEIEQVFFNRPVHIAVARNVAGEDRYVALGQSTAGQLLTVIFTVRDGLVRPISARDMSRRERRMYERDR
jgi:uncharacterized protein